ncbi:MULTISPECIES: type I DNA topoisomerase [unclassified Mesorhizobium]|uniref:type I DNA topoisomerase n=1 Tax=unclassified Mesorhizobium TaxID=325217 RepID=UPI000FCACD58|nr:MULTISPECIES: type I DNA topoisomerase [unclassified Mesorhizobium]TGR38984.1 type I DNA topoisomerase [bacterium M00.F.Ca.ET.199.01.1.1]TGU27596.1 type I DNA topoisomerase [bacterium M00.F.Ca.ET.156.01.1.1]TGV84020.1 type I DNA topoisomerase [Mesorhizobium sp. M00.F.Ca.ET.149.01.1.1]RUW45259.1 type I DNA topoisomerase [Mesorhizobium sp. M8A.F.Ca.ET.021.01.1.1]TGR20709.1 type I DNA topoisomerase [Mesorhizobium sp. M8A.F.Ca.ET.202.01.1.1]
MDVVVVESPAKAKTINKYLGRNYKVLASFGHVRDLPAKDGSVRPDEDFAMSWAVDTASGKRLTDIANAVKDADGLILATDPDREGEAISWHVLEVLKQKRALKDKPVSRVVFNAITKASVLEAMANPRQIDAPLVDAYLARRALDYLVGFTLSPVLWRKLPGARSAGRVQSVALRLVCDRESEIERFIREEYWQIAAILGTPRNETFEARLTAFERKKLQKLDIANKAQADDIKAMLEGATFKALSVEAKPTKRNPGPPFTTSTLQQAASSGLGFSATRTMQVAQRLYEGMDIGGETAGLITYMRTDGVQMAPEAIDAARDAIAKEFGPKYLPEKPRQYTAKAKNAQEAHEAIRPTDFMRTPASVRQYLDADQMRLYELIWKRAIASQMQPAEIERTTVEIEALNGARTAELRAVGSVVRFDGFIAAYTDQKDDDAEDEENRRLPEIRAGEQLARRAINATQHTTEPPPRYSEASLIKKLEELGIGRPSTYTAILKTLEDRDYVTIDKRRLVPQAKGRLLSAFLESFFERYVEYDFTASLEEKLDEISDGKLAWKDVLRDFWKDFSGAVADIKELRVTDVLDALNEELAPLVFPAREDGSNPRICPKCGTGNLSLKLGKFGAFVGCSNYPECSFTRQLGDAANPNGENGGGEDGTKLLGKDPYTAEEITLRSGRFGPYIQRGDGKEAKRSSLPKGWTPESIDHEKALALLALPRDVGQHPESGKMISAGLGRYGPFVLHDGTYANLDSIEDVFSIGLNRAVTVIAEKQSKGKGGRNGGTPAALKELGDHPDGGGKIVVRDGKYGPYVNFGKVNATLPKGKDPQSVTVEDALALIAEKEAKGGGGKKPFRKAAAAKAPTAKKTTTKKAAAKKPAAKKKG